MFGDLIILIRSRVDILIIVLLKFLYVLVGAVGLVIVFCIQGVIVVVLAVDNSE